MPDEPKDDPDGGGGHGGFGRRDEDTIVKVSRDFAAGSLQRLARGLTGAGSRVAELGLLVAEGPGKQGLGELQTFDEIDEDLSDLETMIRLARSGIKRLKGDKFQDLKIDT
jgi:hypothetical protein